MEMMRQTVFKGVMPSLDTIKRHVTSIVGDALYGAGYTDARFNNAIPFFEKLGYKAGVFILINDATAILPAVCWRARDDALLGYAPLSYNSPLNLLRAGHTLVDMLEHHHRHLLATQVELVMLCALAPGYPAYVLAMFPQTAGPPADGVKLRIEIAQQEIEKRGGLVLGYAADGASAQLACMKEMTKACIAAVLLFIFLVFNLH